MSDADDYQRGYEQFQKMVGRDRMAALLERFGAVCPDFEREVVSVVGGRTWTRPGIDLKTRSLCSICVLAAQGRDETFLAKKQHELSGGEAQITALLRAMQLEPEVLLLDEPTAALDDVATKAVEQLLDRWLCEQPNERSIVWVTHDRDQARRVCDRILHLERGRLRES